VKNVVLNERVGIPELGSLQGCESCAFIAFTFILILCLKISEIEGRRVIPKRDRRLSFFGCHRQCDIKSIILKASLFARASFAPTGVSVSFV
jgi:hypothetical protein